jgi:GNAT superfamily N-acetyltransferase
MLFGFDPSGGEQSSLRGSVSIDVTHGCGPRRAPAQSDDTEHARLDIETRSLGSNRVRQAGAMEIRELAPDETGLAYAAMHELRPHVGSKAEFVARVNDVLRPGGYRLIASFDTGDEDAAAAAGFRIADMLAWGHYLYVDDLVTREAARRSGHATALLDWLLAEAERNGCDSFQLDSGVHRHDAHRLYLRWGLSITGHHFGRVLKDIAGR